MHRCGNQRAGKDDDVFVRLRPIASVRPRFQKPGGRRLELAVLARDGESQNRPVIVRGGIVIQRQHDLAALDPHLREGRGQPTDLFHPVLRGQGPAGDSLAHRHLDLGVIPVTALIETAGIADVFVARFLQVKEGLVMRLADIDSLVNHLLEIVVQILRFAVGA